MKCIAVDDEKWALDLLTDNIKHVPFLDLVGRCKNAREASEILQKENIDLMFMDVQMPGLNGLQFITTLPQPPMAILITAYEQYALEGFNLSVIDYLVKPVPLERFVKACNKAKQFFDMKQGTLPADKTTPDHIFVNVEYSLIKVPFKDITYIEGFKDYVKIHLASSSKAVLTRMSLRALEDILPRHKYVRTHKSFIVSIDKVTAIKRDFVCIHENEIPIGESFKGSIQTITGNQSK